MNALAERPRDRGILFSARLVRAILAGRKTQTRRIIRPQPPTLTPEQVARTQSYGFRPAPAAWNKPSLFIVSGDVQAVREHDAKIANNGIRCPYGAAGDRLWVRETWSPDAAGVYPCDPFLYRADVSALAGEDPVSAEHVRDCVGVDGGAAWNSDCYACLRERRGFRWRPSIHMPRRASRIDLEITGVRVERLQDMPADDVEREGVNLDEHLAPGVHYDINNEWWPAGERKALEVFRALWDSINGDRAAWASNPWVWVVSFKRVRP